MVALTSLSLCNSISLIHSSKQSKPWHPMAFPLFGSLNSQLFTPKNGPKMKHLLQNTGRLKVLALTEGSAKKSSSKPEKDGGEVDPSVPSWAKPGSDDPPPWASDEAQKDSSSFEVPFFVYLLASAVTAIAAIGSVFEYVNQKPVFGVLNSDSVFYAPLLGFFVFAGIPTSLQLLEKKHSLSARHSSNPVIRIVKQEDDQFKTISSALEEVQRKGTLIERLKMLENRVLQLSLEMDEENTSKSSSSTVPGSEKLDHGFTSSVGSLRQDENEVTDLQGTQIPVAVKDQDQDQGSSIACDADKTGPKSGRRQSKKAYKKWLGRFHLGCY